MPNGMPHMSASLFDFENASSSSVLLWRTAQTAGYRVCVTIASTPRENCVSEVARPMAPAAARPIVRVAISRHAWPTAMPSPRASTSGHEKWK